MAEAACCGVAGLAEGTDDGGAAVDFGVQVLIIVLAGPFRGMSRVSLYLPSSDCSRFRNAARRLCSSASSGPARSHADL